MKQQTCALIPALNEGEGIARIVREVLPHVDRVIVVDDGSTDATASAAERAGAEVIRHAKNMGKGTAVRAGLRRVLDLGYEWVLLMDGDGQHDPRDVPRMLRAAQIDSPDMVIGRRVWGEVPAGRARSITNRIGARILSRWTGQLILDSQSGFRLVRTRALEGIPLTSRRFEIETEMLIKMCRRGCRLEQVPMQSDGQGPGRPSHLRPFRDVARICLQALRFHYLSR